MVERQLVQCPPVRHLLTAASDGACFLDQCVQSAGVTGCGLLGMQQTTEERRALAVIDW